MAWVVRRFESVLACPRCARTLAGLPFELMESSFFLGRETLIPRTGSSMALWRERLFIVMFRNAHSAADFFCIPANRVVEFGTQVEL